MDTVIFVDAASLSFEERCHYRTLIREKRLWLVEGTSLASGEGLEITNVRVFQTFIICIQV